MIRRPPRSTRTDTLFPYTTLFLRSIQLMAEEADGPIAEEFGRVIAETQLGDPLVDALERMARRLDIRDVDWVVQAIRIQQTVGGKLADLLPTLDRKSTRLNSSH